MAERQETFSIKNITKGRPPRLPYLRIKNAVLGKNFSISLVFVDDRLSRRLNKKYRHKNKPANILSFPLGKQSGEIFLNLKQARREAPLWQLSFPKFISLLFIHALLHLKGMRHGSRMERIEAKLLKQFKV